MTGPPDKPPARRTALRAGAVALLLLVGGGALGLLATGAAVLGEPLLVQEGDELLLHAAMFDAHGRMLYSTRASDLAELASTKANFTGSFVLPEEESFGPVRYLAENATRPLTLADGFSVVIGDRLLGKPVGHKTLLPTVGRYTGYNETFSLDRERGPFARNLRFHTSSLASLSITEHGDRVVLDDLLTGRYLERGEDSTVLRVDLRDGELLRVRDLGLTARVVLDDATDSFRLLLDAPPGHTFSVATRCRFANYHLEPGSYRVSSVGSDAIELERSPTAFTQYIGQDLAIGVEIVAIERAR